MILTRRALHAGARLLGIGMLILGLIHVPLPQADFHNIRHHDAPGEVCLHHDHLLRWHPTANSDEDIAVVHWHWFVPQTVPAAGSSAGDDDHEGPAPVSRPAFHAHLADSLESDWGGEPVISPDNGGRLLERLGFSNSVISLALLSCPVSQSAGSGGFAPHSALSATDGLRAARNALFHRWNC